MTALHGILSKDIFQHAKQDTMANFAINLVRLEISGKDVVADAIQSALMSTATL